MTSRVVEEQVTSALAALAATELIRILDILILTSDQARPPTNAEQHDLRHLSDPVVVTLTGYDDTSMLEVAADGENRLALLGLLAQPHHIA